MILSLLIPDVLLDGERGFRKGKGEGGRGMGGHGYKDRGGKGEGGKEDEGTRVYKGKIQNAPSVEENRAAETLAAFFRACLCSKVLVGEEKLLISRKVLILRLHSSKLDCTRSSNLLGFFAAVGGNFF